jgi:hypothetical protein
MRRRQSTGARAADDYHCATNRLLLTADFDE